jgi:O-antigen ligase
MSAHRLVLIGFVFGQGEYVMSGFASAAGHIPLVRRLVNARVPLALAPVLVLFILFKLAIGDGGRDLQSLALAEAVIVILLAVIVWMGAVRHTAVTHPLLGMVASVALTSLWSVHPEASVRELLLWTMYLGVVVVVSSTLTYLPVVSRFQDVVGAIAGWLCLIALFMFWGAGDAGMRWYSTFYWPNPFAAFLLLVLPPTLVRFLYALRIRDALAYGLMVVLLLVALVFTYSRGAWLALGAVAVVAVMVLRPLRPGKVVERMTALVVLTGLLVFAMSRGTVPRESSQGIVMRAVSVANPSDYSIQGRLSFWRAGLEIFLDHPLLGTGPGTFASVLPAYQRDVRYYSRDAHNLYIQTLAEMGAVGLVAMLMLLVSIGNTWRRTLRAAQGREEYPLIAGVGLGLLAFFLHSALDMDWMFPANPAMAFAFVGLLAWFDSSYRAGQPGVQGDPKPTEPVRADGRWATAATWSRASAPAASLIALAVMSLMWVAQRHFALGQEASRRGDWALAAEHYAAAVRWDPFSSRYLDAYASALVRPPEPRYPLAADVLRRAMALDRMNAALPLHLAAVLTSAGSDPVAPSEAENLLRRALALDRFNRPETYRALADLYRGHGRLEEAWGVYREAMNLYSGRSLGQGSPLYLLLWPGVIALFQDAAEFAAAQGALDQAAQVLERLLGEDPTAVGAVLQLSDLYIKMHRPGDARARLEATVRWVPNNPQIIKALNALR